MNTIISAAITALAVGAAVTAHAANGQPRQAQPAYPRAVSEVTGETYAEAGRNVASLSSLLAEWDQAGFATPSKPSQYRVYGRNGYATSGPGYNAMVSLIRGAMSDSRKGSVHDAGIEIAKARSLLAASHLRRAYSQAAGLPRPPHDASSGAGPRNPQLSAVRE
jgi:hypothetical protein